MASIPIELTQAIASSGGGSLALRMRQGDPQAVQEGLALVVQPKEKKGLKKQLMEVMGQVAKAEFLPALLQVVSNEKDMELVSVSLGALHAYGSEEVARTVLRRYPSMSSEAKLSAEALLALRLSTSRLLVGAVEAKQVEEPIWLSRHCAPCCCTRIETWPSGSKAFGGQSKVHRLRKCSKK